MFGTSKVVLVIFLFSLINCTQGLSMFGLRNFKEGKKKKKKKISRYRYEASV